MDLQKLVDIEESSTTTRKTMSVAERSKVAPWGLLNLLQLPWLIPLLTCEFEEENHHLLSIQEIHFSESEEEYSSAVFTN